MVNGVTLGVLITCVIATAVEVFLKNLLVTISSGLGTFYLNQFVL